MKACLDEAIEEGLVTSGVNRKRMKKLGLHAWDDAFETLGDLRSTLDAGEGPDEIHLMAIDRLMKYRENTGRRAALHLDRADIQEAKNDLVKACADEGVFVLSAGAIEQYYPDGTKSDKIGSALELNEETPADDLRDCFVSITFGGVTRPDLEFFLETIFESE